jgi:hypothetical protein
MSTKEICQRLLSVIREKRPDAIQYLGEGLSREEIESKIKSRSIPEALLDLYSCISFSNYDFFGYIISGSWNLIPIDNINDEIEFQQNMNIRMLDKYPDFVYEKYSEDMIPFLEDGGGNIVCVKNLPHDQSVWYLDKVLDPYLYYISIDHYLLTSIACYEREAYFFDEEEKFWTCDPYFEQEISDEIRLSLESRKIE